MSNATRGWERTFGGHILVGCKNDLLLCEVSESAYRPDLIVLMPKKVKCSRCLRIRRMVRREGVEPSPITGTGF